VTIETGTRLPSQPVGLIDRQAELSAIRDLLLHSGRRLITLTGLGGVGKTRLAVAVAADMAERCAEGARFVDLSPLNDPRLVLPAIAHALGVREGGARSIEEILQDAIGDRELLLVLDNFEHLLSAATDIGRLLEACVELHILVTSREPLGLRWEQNFPVNPLPVPTEGARHTLEEMANIASVTLFVERARAVRADFHLTPENADAVADICRALDGLPLALELAAARLRIMSPTALAARMEGHLGLLAARIPDAPVRHQTLRTAIDWSYALLSADEAALFRRIAVFADSCAVDGAVAVVDGQPREILDRLGSLVDKSLVVAIEAPDGEPRFRLLHTVREYALEQLRAEGEEVTARDAHAQYVQAFADRTPPRIWFTQHDRALIEHGDVRAAVRWLLDRGDIDAAGRLIWWLGMFWWTRGLVEDAPVRGAEVLAAAGDHARLARARAATAAYIGHFLRGELTQAHALLNLAEADFRAEGTSLEIGLTLVWRSFFSPRFGSMAESLEWLHTAEVLLDQAGDRWGVALTLSCIGEVLALGGDPLNGEAYAQRALAIARELGDRRSIGHFLQELGFIALLRSDLESARNLFSEALPVLLETGHHELLAYSLSAVAMLAMRQGQRRRAAHLDAAAIALRRAHGLAVWPLREKMYAETLQSLRAESIDPEVLRARDEGRLVTPAQAVAYALAWDETVETPAAVAHDGLSARETEVAALIARGMTSREIADLLIISEKTADSHADHIRTKLGLRSRAEIAAWVVGRGLAAAGVES
jgi:non-specific serine/threonine protein kinase